MADDQIRDILTEKKVKDFETRKARIVDGLAEIIETVTKANAVAKGIELGLKSSGSFTVVKTGAVQATKAIDEFSKTKQQLISTTQRLNLLQTEEARELIHTRELVRQKTAEIKAQGSEYKLLVIQYNAAAAKAKDLAVAYGVESRQAKAAAASAGELRKRLLDAEKSVGQFQRQVGQYNVVGESFNQLLREAPNFANGFRVVISAMGNNFTYFIEAIKKARGEGASFKDIAGLIGKELFGLVGIVNIAYTAFAIFAEKIFDSGDEAEKAQAKIDKYRSAIDDLVNSTKEYNEQIDKSTDVGSAALQRKVELLRAQGATEKEVLEATTALRKKEIENLKEEKDLYGALSAAFIRLQNNKGASSEQVEREVGEALPPIGREKYLEEIKKAIDDGIDLTEFYSNKQIEIATKISDKENDILEEQAAVERRAREKAQREYEKAAEERRRIAEALADAQDDLAQKQALSEIAIEKQKIEQLAAAEQATIDSDRTTYDERFDAINKFYDYKILAEENARDRAILAIQQENIEAESNARKRELTEEEKADVIARSQKQIEEAIQASATAIAGINLKRNEDVKKADADMVKLILSQIKNIEENNKAVQDSEIAALTELLSKKKIKWKEYQRQVATIEAETNALTQKQIQDYLTEQIETLRQYGIDVSAIQAAITAAFNKANEAVNEANKNTARTAAENAKAIQDAYTQLGAEIAETFQQIQDQIYQQQIAFHEAAIGRIKSEYELELAYIDTVAKSEEEAEELRLQAKARAFFAEKQQEQQIAAIKRKQAAADKVAAIGDIVAKTATAIISAYASTAPAYVKTALAIAYGAIGAAQLARVIATPLPQFAKGGHHKGGPAVVGELGAELFRDRKTGKVGITPDGPTVIHFPNPVDIITADKTSQLMRNETIKALAIGGKKVNEYDYANALIDAYERTGRRMEKAISKISPVVFEGVDAKRADYIRLKTKR